MDNNICPRCGSNDIATSIENKYPIFYCNRCKTNFGEKVNIKGSGVGREDYVQSVTKLSFGIQVMMFGNFYIEIRKNKDGCVAYCNAGPDGCTTIDYEKAITCEMFNDIIEKMFKELYLLDWKEEYKDPNPTSSIEWKLVITLINDNIIISGNDMLPVYWLELRKILEQLFEEFKDFKWNDVD